MRTVQRRDLKPWQRQLLEAAERASETANCPFSGYPVGSAVRVRTRSGDIVNVTGTNSESANYRSVCAEKHAVHRALAEHSWREDGELMRPQVTAVAVYCAVGAAPQQPCGDCRETLHEVNPDMEVIAAAGPSRSGVHDPRVTLTTVRTLLPHGFELASLRGEYGAAGAAIHEAQELEKRVLHLPQPGDLAADASARRELLRGVTHLIVAGSPRRVRRIAELAHRRFGAAHGADESCYCDLTVPGRDESGREFAVYVCELPSGAKVAVASHGVGMSGVELVLSELPALIALAQDGEPPRIDGVIRCGTRGTLSRVPLGCIALSTACHNDHLERLTPSPAWLDRLRSAARSRGMTVVGDEEIDARGEDDWPPAAETLVEGPGIATTFFWEGQSRPLYRADGSAASGELLRLDRRQRAARLQTWVRAGIRWIEMEDYTVLRVAELCGLPAVTLGAVVGHRRRADSSFQTDYGKEVLAASELLPGELALEAIAAGR